MNSSIKGKVFSLDSKGPAGFWEFVPDVWSIITELLQV